MLTTIWSFLSRLTVTGASQGNCFTCERYSDWAEHGGYYRCDGCGQDPVEHRPE